LQVNFVVCQLVALALAVPFRRVLAPNKTSATVRHLVELLVGLALTVFCFG
jgi:lysophospholipid acyltransferase 1/2